MNSAHEWTVALHKLHNGASYKPLLWLIEHGEEFMPAPKPRYTYCEGYATCVIPVHHAWVVTSDGTVIDNTWRKPPPHVAYFGLRVRLKFLNRILLKHGRFGLFFAGDKRDRSYDRIDYDEVKP